MKSIISRLYKKLTYQKPLTLEESRELLLKKMDFKIQNGPFKGMKYINKSNGSVLIPKIAGIYEHEIQDIIELIIKRAYKNYIDIGCAEGYYAVGIAYRLAKINNNATVYAYDTNENALENLKLLAAKNGVLNSIRLGHLFESKNFNDFEGETLVICDIEGAELGLLDPEKGKNLLNFDMLVEVHDGGEKSNIIKETLRKRFAGTHNLQLFSHKKLDKRVFPIITDDCEKHLMNEWREFGIEWMWLQKKQS